MKRGCYAVLSFFLSFFLSGVSFAVTVTYRYKDFTRIRRSSSLEDAATPSPRIWNNFQLITKTAPACVLEAGANTYCTPAGTTTLYSLELKTRSLSKTLVDTYTWSADSTAAECTRLALYVFEKNSSLAVAQKFCFGVIINVDVGYAVWSENILSVKDEENGKQNIECFVEPPGGVC